MTTMKTGSFWNVAAVVVLAAGVARADVCAEREATRVRAGVTVLGEGGSASPALSYGVGVAADLGLVLSERWTLAARASASGIIMFMVGRLGLNAEYALNDTVTLGVGAAWARFGHLVTDLPDSAAVLVPLRLDLALGAQGSTSGRREGWVASVEVAPGVGFWGQNGYVPATVPPPKFPALAFAASVGLGYAWR